MKSSVFLITLLLRASSLSQPQPRRKALWGQPGLKNQQCTCSGVAAPGRCRLWMKGFLDWLETLHSSPHDDLGGPVHDPVLYGAQSMGGLHQKASDRWHVHGRCNGGASCRGIWGRKEFRLAQSAGNWLRRPTNR